MLPNGVGGFGAHVPAPKLLAGRVPQVGALDMPGGGPKGMVGVPHVLDGELPVVIPKGSMRECVCGKGKLLVRLEIGGWEGRRSMPG